MGSDQGAALHSPRGRGILAATVLASGMAFLDGTVVNVALPTLARELGPGGRILVCLSGRGDKDMASVEEYDRGD